MEELLNLFDFAGFGAWLAMLLYWLNLLEDSVSGLWENAQQLIKKYTKGKFKSIIIWLLATTVLQSSSVVSLIIIAFVWSGVIWITEWVGMIIWANIWTTLMDNLVAFLSFSDGNGFSIKDLIYPMLWIWWILWFFIKKYRFVLYGIFGLWLMFMGLDFMKWAMSVLPELVDLETLSQYPIFIFFLIWLLMAGAMHSSSWVTLLTITALATKIINLRMWLAIMIWANIWTCVTAIMWAIWKWATSKQIAYSHLFFNIITAIFFGIIFARLPEIMQYANTHLARWIWYESSDEKALIWFIIFFDIVGAIIIYPFMDYFIMWIQKLLPESKQKSELYIDRIDDLKWEFAIENLKKDILWFFENCKSYNLEQIQIHSGKDNSNKFKKYNHLKNIHDRLMKYISSLDQMKLPLWTNTDILQNIINNAFYSVKYLEDIDHNMYQLYASDNPICKEYFDYFSRTTNKLYVQIDNYLSDKQQDESIIKSNLSDIWIQDSEYINKFTDNNSNIENVQSMSDIITIHKYYYISCENLVQAAKDIKNNKFEIQNHVNTKKTKR